MTGTEPLVGNRNLHPANSFTAMTGHQIKMAKLMALSILAYLAVPVLLFFAADRAFSANWPGVFGFLLDAAGAFLLARMINWASSNL